MLELSQYCEQYNKICLDINEKQRLFIGTDAIFYVHFNFYFKPWP